MSLATAYSLPFAFRISASPLWGEGVSTRLKLVFNGSEPMETAREVFTTKMMHFGVLCAMGAFGTVASEEFNPIAPLIQDVEEDKRSLAWTLKDWPATDEAVSVLASLFMGDDGASLLAEVELSGNGQPCVATLEQQPRNSGQYPATRALPFPWHIEWSGDDEMTLHVAFESKPKRDAREAITETLTMWAAAASAGAYGIDSLEPLKCGFIVEEEIDWQKDGLSFRLSHFRAHPDALDGLGNVCGLIHERFSKIREAHVK